MANFDNILENLHNSSTLADTELETPIEITSRRTFVVPSDYDLVLGYVGDVNSQLVTFKFPKKHEGHDLSKCSFKKLKWQNLTSGTEGVSDLSVQNESDWTATWAVPPEVMTAAGKIEIAISIYDEKDGFIAFSWNTPSFKEFSVGSTANQIADTKQEDISSLPASSEILIINAETRQIEAPINWNPLVASYGDIGISKIFFEINQYIRGLNLVDNDVVVEVGVAFDTDTVEYFEITDKKPMFFAETNKKANKLLLTWNIPPEVTNNEQAYTGPFAISLKIEQQGEDKAALKRWSTAQFNKVTIGTSGVLKDIDHLYDREELIIRRVVDKYFDDNFFVIDNND